MAPQTSIPTAATVLGLIGTICWCVQLLPQIYRNYRTKSTEGLPASMMLMWSASGFPFGVYAILQNFNVPVQVQPQCFCLFCMVTWGQCLYYGRKWGAWKATLTCAVLLAILGGLQALFVLVIREPYSRGVEWPVTTFGAIAFVVLIAGYLPIPFELVKRRGRVVGIDFLFLAIDWSGAFFSLMSLVAQNTFDVIFGTLYALCAAIELSMFLSHGVWLFRTRKLRRKAKEAGVTFDEFPEYTEWQSKATKLNFKIMNLSRSRTDEVSGPDQNAQEAV